MHIVYHEYPPKEAMRHLVRNFYHVDFRATYTQNYMLPNGLPTLFYLDTKGDIEVEFFDNYHVDMLNKGVYVGYMDTLAKYAHSEIKLYGANCFPVMFSMLFKEGLDQLINRCIRLEDVRELDELPQSTDLTEQEIFQMLEKYMLRKTCEYPGNEKLTYVYERLMLEEEYQYTTEDLALWAACSTRHLRSQFHTYLGMAPKKFLQIIRFNRALWYMDRKVQNLSQIAHLCGYCDQAHFINNFKKICGRKPTDIQDINTSLAIQFRLFK